MDKRSHQPGLNWNSDHGLFFHCSSLPLLAVFIELLAILRASWGTTSQSLFSLTFSLLQVQKISAGHRQNPHITLLPPHSFPKKRDDAFCSFCTKRLKLKKEKSILSYRSNFQENDQLLFESNKAASLTKPEQSGDKGCSPENCWMN